LLVALKLLAFSFHAVAHVTALAWRNAVAARGASYRFFEHQRAIAAYVVFPTGDDLMVATANPTPDHPEKTRPNRPMRIAGLRWSGCWTIERPAVWVGRSFSGGGSLHDPGSR
jgi:hypothetical protein